MNPEDIARGIIDIHPECLFASVRDGEGRYLVDCGNRETNTRLEWMVMLAQREIAAEIETLRAQLAAAEKARDGQKSIAVNALISRRESEDKLTVRDIELAAMRERAEKAEAHANKNARKALGCDLIVSVFEKAASGELTPMQKVHIDTEVALDWVDRAKKAESHLLTLAEECWTGRHIDSLCPMAAFLDEEGSGKRKEYDDAINAKRDARAATDAAGSLAFAAGIKERKETGNAQP